MSTFVNSAARPNSPFGSSPTSPASQSVPQPDRTGLKRPSAEILQQIARALEVSAESLYVRAGILDEEPEADLIAAIRAQDDLTHDQKQVLIQVYESFLAQNEM